MVILGISAYYHDSAASLLIDGKILAAAQEERFSRVKHDSSFPNKACRFCLDYANITIRDVDQIVFYEKPFLKFERIIESHIEFAPRSFFSFIKVMPIWLKERLNLRSLIQCQIKKEFGENMVPIKFVEHHWAHAAFAYYSSPYDSAAILVVDAVGEWATTSLMYGKGTQIEVIKEQHFPHSIGLLYSSFTYFLGFKVNSDEYKVMGLAPYGKVESEETKEYIKVIMNQLVNIKNDGSIIINTKHFSYHYGFKMINPLDWKALFHINQRKEGEAITQSHCNLAYAIQYVTELIALRLVKTLKIECGSSDNLCISGGTALNCAMNGKIIEDQLFKNCFVPYSPGDGGGAIGACLATYYLNSTKRIENKMPYLGPAFLDCDIEKVLIEQNIAYQFFEDDLSLTKKVAASIAEGKIIGWFQGRMEFGPRALGNRSILADCRNEKMKQRVNSTIKFREEFRPFAPAILVEDIDKYFKFKQDSPYMMFTCKVQDLLCTNNEQRMDFAKAVNMCLSTIPAVTHIDKTARIQTVSKEDNAMFHLLLSSYKEQTGCSVLLNTSFNVMGEPIVCSPQDAIHTFYESGIDCLVINHFIINK